MNHGLATSIVHARRHLHRPSFAAIAFLLVVGAAAVLSSGRTAIAVHPDDAVADFVLGQTDFSTGNACAALSDTSICDPRAIAVDAEGNVYVAENTTDRSRVLRFNDPLNTDKTADAVYGQPDFVTGNGLTCPAATDSTLCRPAGLALDLNGAGTSDDVLYVVDTGDHRVLIYTDPKADLVGVADVVLGAGPFCDDSGAQPSSCFNNSTCNALGGGGPIAASLCNPVGVLVHPPSGDVYVSDGNNRVLRYDDLADEVVWPDILLADRTPDLVLGQPDFTSGNCNQGGTPTAATLCNPQGLAFDNVSPGIRLYVSDPGNNRALFYHGSPGGLTNGQSANFVMGQGGSFTTNSCLGTASASTLCAPLGIAIDLGNDDAYITDQGKHRVLEYSETLAAANVVYGQATGDFDNELCNDAGLAPEARLCNPVAVAVDGRCGDLYVADAINHRVLMYRKASGGANNDLLGGPFGGTQPWIVDGVSPEGLRLGADGCDINDDNDLRCTDIEEEGGNLALGGMRDPLNPWDFADVPVPALPAAGVRNGAVSLPDVAAALAWVGRTMANGTDGGGHNYTHDNNANGVQDGAEYDRTPAGEISGPPNGAISLSDVGVILIQVNDNCNALPN
jgi:hypothetical protein